ncbi:MAG: aminodeoxychorismate lyase [Firmicutes bacterium]|nr:aminodeoxychorismate lyase [Bacillota bacterium]
MKKWVFLNKKFVEYKKASIPVSDRGFLYGDGIFETFKAGDGNIFRLDQHIGRLMKGAGKLGIKCPYQEKDIEGILGKILKKNGLKNAWIKIILTRGSTKGRLLPEGRVKPVFLVTAGKFIGYPRRMYREGISLAVSLYMINSASVTAGIKSLNYLDNVTARIEAERSGFDDALILNEKEMVVSATAGNIFGVKKGVLYTPGEKSGILPGITRREVIKLAGKLGIKVIEKEFDVNELLKMDEVFLTNTLMGIMPVVRVWKKRVGSGRVGEITGELSSQMEEWT